MANSKIPSVLKSKDRWLVFKRSKKKDGKIELYNPKNTRKIDSTDVASCGSFNDAVNAMNGDTAFSMAYVLDKNEYALAIKGAINPGSNRLQGIARSMLSVLGSYAERDNSGESINVLFTLNKITGDVFSDKLPDDVAIKHHGDFVPMLGVPYGNYTAIEDCSDKIDSLREILIGTSGDDKDDDIFLSLSQEKKIANLPIDNLVEFTAVAQPFKPYSNDKFAQMVKSIQTHGVLSPIIVRPHPNQDGKHEIVSGHNRVLAAKEAGLVEVPALIEPMDDDTAVMVLVESNFKQRHDLSFSEKARAYRLKHEIHKKQGKRNDLYGDPQLRDKFVTKSMVRTTDIIGSDDNKSGRTIYRYIRLTELTDEFLSDVDDGRLAFNTAVELSHLTLDEQENLYGLLKEKDIKITLRQAEALKKAKDNNEYLDAIRMFEILDGIKPKDFTKRRPIKLPYESISHFFEEEDLTDEDINNKIIEALTQYYNK